MRVLFWFCDTFEWDPAIKTLEDALETVKLSGLVPDIRFETGVAQIPDTTVESLGEEPFFMWVHLMEPHSPYLPPPPYDRVSPRAFSPASDLEINGVLYNYLHRQWGAKPEKIVHPSLDEIGIDYVEGGWPGLGNDAADPLFIDALAGDFGLRGGSPCIDSGDPSYPPDPDGSRTDMGALWADPAFCAGLDLKELGAGETGGPAALQERDAIAAATAFEGPIIGAVNGVAITGGFELALACDFLIASTEARFADTHARVGVVPGWGLSQRLPRLIGINRAKELSLTGNFLNAQQACEWGLVNRVVSEPQLEAAVQQLVAQITRFSSEVIAIGKEAFYRQLELDLSGAYDYAADVMVRNMLARDAEEGINAFIEKRPPRWEGR